MEFHDEKTVIMTNSKDKPQIILNNKVVPKVDEYKYLGDVLTAEESYTELIRERRSAITGTVAELVTISNEIQQKNVIAAVQYPNGIIIPKLLINSEAWNTLNNQDQQQLEQCQSQSIKRLLHLPYTTPTKGLKRNLG